MNGLRRLWLPALVAGIGAVLMVLVLLRALLYGDLAAEGRQLLEMPWGLMSLVDIYTGLLLFSCWIFWRERHRPVAVLWLLGLLLFGNLASCLYIIFAVLRSHGDINRFIHGHRASGQDTDLDTTRQIHRIPGIPGAHKH